MGLIYSSSESSELMQALSANLTSGKEAVNQLKTGSQKVIAAIDGQTLSGAAYTAGKGLFSELIIPTISKVTKACENIEQKLEKYKTADQLVSSEGHLDEDKLKRQIAIKKSMKSSIDFVSSVVKTALRSDTNTDASDSLLDFQKNLGRMSSSLQDDIDKLNKKIEKLHEFSSKTSGLFNDSLNDMKLAMQGVMVLNKTIVNSDGTYAFPVGVDKSWFTTKKDVDAWTTSPSYAIENMPENMTAEETEDWLAENLAKFGPDFMELLKGSQKVGESLISFKNGKAFLKGISVTQDSLGRLRWGDRFLWKPGNTYKHGKKFGEASGIDLGDYHYSRLPDGGINYSELTAAGWTGFKEAVNPINDFKGWKDASKFGKFGKGLGIVGTGMTVVNNFAENVDLSDGLDGREVVNFATDTAIDVGAGAGTAAFGAMVGSAFLPPLGTVAGAAAGALANIVINHKFGAPPKSAVDHVKDGVKRATKAIGDKIGDLVGGFSFGFGG